jgi:hypothetical protein
LSNSADAIYQSDVPCVPQGHIDSFHLIDTGIRTINLSVIVPALLPARVLVGLNLLNVLVIMTHSIIDTHQIYMILNQQSENGGIKSIC